MKTRPRKYKTRPSRLDPYMDEIAEMLSAGCTYGEIAEKMSQHFDDKEVTLANIAYIAEKKGLKSKITQGARNNRLYIPDCEKCEHCEKVINTTGTSTTRVCMAKKPYRAVSRSVTTSPMYCPKRELNRGVAHVHGCNC